MSNVTATVTDSDGQTWNNGSWFATLSLPGGIFSQQKPTVGGVKVATSVSGVLDNSGALSTVLTDTSTLDQAGGQWQLTFVPNVSVSIYAKNARIALAPRPIVGASVDLTLLLNAVPAPRIPAGEDAFAYRDSEVIPSIPGIGYFNVSSDPNLAGPRIWDGNRWVGVANHVNQFSTFSGTPQGVIDGVNRTFTLVNGVTPLTQIPALLEVYLNTAIVPNSGYTISMSGGVVQITYAVAPQPAAAGVPADSVYAQGITGSNVNINQFVTFAGTPQGTIDGTNKTFTLMNGATPLTSIPVLMQASLNSSLIPNVGFTLAIVGGFVKITYATAPQPASGSAPADVIYAQGVLSL